MQPPLLLMILEVNPVRLTPKRSNETGREYALRTIKDNIIGLELAPGSLISENELAEEMCLSRTPIREALIDLSKVKMIEITPQKRSTVAYIDYDLVEEARFMRNVLECAVIELVCQLRTDEDLKKLEENVKLQRFYLENGACGSLMELDNLFHKTLFEIAQKQLAYQMIQQMSIHFDRVRSIALNTVKDFKIVQDHENMIDALAKSDAALAKAIMEKHLNRYKLDEQVIRKTYPQYFL